MDKKIQVNDNKRSGRLSLEDIEVLLLDDDGKEVAFNEIGEMSVRSRYLSPGYWRRPELHKLNSCPSKTAETKGFTAPGIWVSSLMMAAWCTW